MVSVSRQGAKPLLAKSKPSFKTTFDLLSRKNVFSIEVKDAEGKIIKVALPEEEVKDAMATWKKQLDAAAKAGRDGRKPLRHSVGIAVQG
jgi:hypothetical protein